MAVRPKYLPWSHDQITWSPHFLCGWVGWEQWQQMTYASCDAELEQVRFVSVKAERPLLSIMWQCYAGPDQGGSGLGMGGPAWRGSQPGWGPARQRGCRRDSKRPSRLRNAQPKKTAKIVQVLNIKGMKGHTHRVSHPHLSTAGSALISPGNISLSCYTILWWSTLLCCSVLTWDRAPDFRRKQFSDPSVASQNQ